MGTYDQGTILLIYCFLLGELDVVSKVHPEGGERNATDLILNDRVPNSLRKFTDRMHVPIIFLVSE